MATRRAIALNADAATKPGAAQSSRDGALKHCASGFRRAAELLPAQFRDAVFFLYYMIIIVY